MKKISILIIFFICSCSTNRHIDDLVQIEQINSNYPVILRGDIEKNEIFALKFMFAYKIRKKSSKKIDLKRDCNYYSKRRGNWRGGNFAYLNKNGELSNDTEYLDYNYKEYYVGYQYGYLDSDTLTQRIFQPYMEKTKQENKDTLHIESIQELKKINPELINGFLQGDSIRFRFRYGKKYGTITLPVEVK